MTSPITSSTRRRRLAATASTLPILATFVASIVADLIALGIAQLVTDAGSTALPVDLILAAATLNAAIAGLLLYPARLVARRYGADEAVAW